MECPSLLGLRTVPGRRQAVTVDGGSSYRPMGPATTGAGLWTRAITSGSARLARSTLAALPWLTAIVIVRNESSHSATRPRGDLAVGQRELHVHASCRRSASRRRRRAGCRPPRGARAGCSASGCRSGRPARPRACTWSSSTDGGWTTSRSSSAGSTGGADLLDRQAGGQPGRDRGEHVAGPEGAGGVRHPQRRGRRARGRSTTPPATSHACDARPLSGATKVEPSAVRTAMPREGTVRNGSTSARCTAGTGR